MVSNVLFHISVLVFHVAASVDCPVVISLARNLNLNLVQPTIWNQLQTNCCTATGVTCDSNPYVTRIIWESLGLNGTISTIVLPSNLQWLRFGLNSISGPLPTNWASWPSSLYQVILKSNELTGNIPNTKPGTVTDFWVQDNLLTGPLPSNLLISLTELHVGSNFLSGDLPSFPASMVYLYLGWKTDSCSVVCNKFTGTLRLIKPIWFTVNFNLITNIVITDISGLTNCDVSNNPLLGNPSLSSLGICSRNNLYAASLLPNTRISTTTTLKSNIKFFSNTIILAASTVQTSKGDFNSQLENLFYPPQSAVQSNQFRQISSTKIYSMTNHNFRSEEQPERTILLVSILPTKSLSIYLTFTAFVVAKFAINLLLIGFIFSKTPIMREMKSRTKKVKNRS